MSGYGVSAQAGTLESSDALVTVQRGENGSGVQVELDSAVAGRFGQSINAMIADLVRSLGVPDARINVVDRGAVNFIMTARVETAVRRLLEIEERGES